MIEFYKILQSGEFVSVLFQVPQEWLFTDYRPVWYWHMLEAGWNFRKFD